MSEKRYEHGGDGSHWDGCAEAHWDCKIVLLETEKAYLKSIIAGKDQTLSEMAIEIADLKRSLNMAQSILSLISKHPISTQLEAAALKQLAVNYQTITQVMG